MAPLVPNVRLSFFLALLRKNLFFQGALAAGYGSAWNRSQGNHFGESLQL